MEIKGLYKRIHNPDNVIVANVVVQLCGEKNAPTAISSLDKPLHPGLLIASVQSITHQRESRLLRDRVFTQPRADAVGHQSDVACPAKYELVQLTRHLVEAARQSDRPLIQANFASFLL
jgi:hypothetical protein